MRNLVIGALAGGFVVWYTNDTYVAPINIEIKINVNAEKQKGEGS